MMKLGILIAVLAIALLFAFVARGNGLGKSLLMLGSNFILGFGSLYALNLLAPQSGFAVPLNSITVAASGVLGLPGTMLAAAIQIFLPV